MKSQPSIEPAWPEDQLAISKLLDENALPEPTPAESVSFIVARRDGHVVGCLGWEIFDNEVLLRSLAVSTALQRMGIGSLLVKKLLERLTVSGFSEFYLLTTDASDFAYRFGFRLTDRCSIPEPLKAAQQINSKVCASAQCMRLKALDSPVG